MQIKLQAGIWKKNYSAIYFFPQFEYFYKFCVNTKV